MRNKTKKSLIIASSIGLGITAIATTATLTACSKNNKETSDINKESSENLFTWGTGSNENQITGLTDLGKQQTNIILPARATSIANNVFYNNQKIQSVDMSLTSITTIPNGDGSGLFYGCTSLTSVILPNGITSIGSYTFAICSSLTSINIPSSVTSIGSYAFFVCSSLTSINIPDSVTSIGDAAFANCSSLTSVTLPDGLTSIFGHTFNNCTGLTSINIPNSVTSIAIYAFRFCSSLTVNIPSSVTSIAIYAFYSVKQVNVPTGNTTLANLVRNPWGYTGTIGYY